MVEASHSFDPDERRREAMMDGSGFSDYTADARLGDEAISGAVDPPRFAHPERTPLKTGHVRDFESDRDHEDAALRAEYEPLTDKQIAERRVIAAQGRKAVETALDEAFGKDRKIKAIEARVERMIPIDPDNVDGSMKARARQVDALLRTHFDNKAS